MRGRLCAMQKFEPVAIGRVERFVADWEAAEGPLPVPQLLPVTGKKVAIVGSGPAGLNGRLFGALDTPSPFSKLCTNPAVFCARIVWSGLIQR